MKCLFYAIAAPLRFYTAKTHNGHYARSNSIYSLLKPANREETMAPFTLGTIK
jgi:hypothetical protein